MLNASLSAPCRSSELQLRLAEIELNAMVGRAKEKFGEVFKPSEYRTELEELGQSFYLITHPHTDLVDKEVDEVTRYLPDPKLWFTQGCIEAYETQMTHLAISERSH